jgi:ribosomal protein S18 acetylase RimI-like enzyme
VWRPSTETDDGAIVSMCVALYVEDPGLYRVEPAQVKRTLERFRAEPLRGRSLVLELEGRAAGYALLSSYWSNELGGEVCMVDELYLEPAARSRGFATALCEALVLGSPLWPRPAVALGLEVTPGNRRALALYERLGFAGKNRVMHRRTAG